MNGWRKFLIGLFKFSIMAKEGKNYGQIFLRIL